MWFLNSSIAGGLSAVFNYFNRYVLKENEDSTAYAWYFELIRFSFFALVGYSSLLTPYSIKIIFLLFVSGMLEILGVYIYMKMHTFSELSVSTIISRTRLIWVPVFAFIILGERLGTREYLGILTLFIGVITVASPRKLAMD